MRVEFGHPSPERFEGAPRLRVRRGGREDTRLFDPRDLAPARGMFTAVGLGAALWTVVLLVVRAITA